MNGDDNVIDFTYVTDVARGLELATASDAAASETFNITRGEGRSLADAAEIVRHHFPHVRVKEARDPTNFRPRRGALDITKARDLIGYRPKISLARGIAEYMESMRMLSRQEKHVDLCLPLAVASN
jgi:UDP-glucose 4-epimerase